ncbi:unnamed protein product [Chrysodeixis includens]|uniref:Uncharacterized protein n=1 Tax=Chrysodeixis includens TaxID=689277 RepID=A0A9N8PXQ3_CHRIL|nr:unnamed protein product [Chrysodeixis includens]
MYHSFFLIIQVKQYVLQSSSSVRYGGGVPAGLLPPRALLVCRGCLLPEHHPSRPARQHVAIAAPVAYHAAPRGVLPRRSCSLLLRRRSVLPEHRASRPAARHVAVAAPVAYHAAPAAVAYHAAPQLSHHAAPAHVAYHAAPVAHVEEINAAPRTTRLPRLSPPRTSSVTTSPQHVAIAAPVAYHAAPPQCPTTLPRCHHLPRCSCRHITRLPSVPLTMLKRLTLTLNTSSTTPLLTATPDKVPAREPRR